MVLQHVLLVSGFHTLSARGEVAWTSVRDNATGRGPPLRLATTDPAFTCTRFSADVLLQRVSFAAVTPTDRQSHPANSHRRLMRVKDDLRGAGAGPPVAGDLDRAAPMSQKARSACSRAGKCCARVVHPTGLQAAMKLTEHAVEQCSRVAITTVTPGKVVRAGRHSRPAATNARRT